MVTVRNKFDILQEISKINTPNDNCENFVTTYIEAATGCLQTEQRAKYRVPWGSLVVRKKNKIA